MPDVPFVHLIQGNDYQKHQHF